MYMLCVVLHDVYVIYVVHAYRVGTGRFLELEPEGSQSWVHGPIELWPRVANMCFMCGILGNSLSFVLTVLVLLFQVLAMTVGRRRLDLYTRRGIRYNYVILGFV